MIKKIYIDTDLGYDDLISICLLFSSKKYQVRAISLVNGVSSINKGIENLIKILKYLKIKNITLIKGKSKTIKDNWKAFFPLKDRQRAIKLELIKKLPLSYLNKKRVKIYPLKIYPSLLKTETKKITLVCLGPLTNIAYLIKTYGKLFTDKVEQVYIMGGAIKTPGIVPPLNLVEYNIYLDPEAAKIVFNSSLPITLVPVDATYDVPAMAALAKKVEAKILLKQLINKLQSQNFKSNVSLLIKEIILNNQYDFNRFYDPIVAGIMIKPKMIKKTLQGNITIITKGKCRGQTKLINGISNKNINIIIKVKSNIFYKLLISLLN